MQFFEKYINSKFYAYTEYLFKIIWLSVLMFLTMILGLFVVGFPLAISAGVFTIAALKENKDLSVGSYYFQILKNIFKKPFKIWFFFLPLLMVLTFNLVFFQKGFEDFSWFYFISYMLTFLVFLITIIALFHALVITVIYDEKVITLVKYSYLLSVAFIVRGIIFILIAMGIVFLAIWIPILGFDLGGFSFIIVVYYVLIGGYVRVPALNEDFKEKLEELNLFYRRGE
jgi:uncharacterized membrane protein YesL